MTGLGEWSALRDFFDTSSSNAFLYSAEFRAYATMELGSFSYTTKGTDESDNV